MLPLAVDSKEVVLSESLYIYSTAGLSRIVKHTNIWSLTHICLAKVVF